MIIHLAPLLPPPIFVLLTESQQLISVCLLAQTFQSKGCMAARRLLCKTRERAECCFLISFLAIFVCSVEVYGFTTKGI